LIKGRKAGTVKDDRDIAEELFGSIRRIRVAGDHKVNVLELIQTLAWEEGIMRLFRTYLKIDLAEL
jgi:hypothetical protein